MKRVTGIEAIEETDNDTTTGTISLRQSVSDLLETMQKMCINASFYDVTRLTTH